VQGVYTFLLRYAFTRAHGGAGGDHYELRDKDVEVTSFVCSSCLLLNVERNSDIARKLAKLVERTNTSEVARQTNHVFLTFQQLADRCSKNREKNSMNLLVMWKMRRKIAELNQCRTDSARIVQMLAQNDLTRVGHFLNSLVVKKASPGTILKAISKIIDQDMTRRLHCNQSYIYIYVYINMYIYRRLQSV